MADLTGMMQAAAGGGGDANYIEDVFSTYLWTSTGSNVVINNGIDLSTEGGLVWEKCRSDGVGHTLTDTARGVNKTLETNSTSAESTGGVQTFSTDGFTTSANIASRTFVGWTFRKQPKFFDVVTWTGDGTSTRQVPHNLASTPGCVFYKKTSTTNNWVVWHRSTSNFAGLLNGDAAFIYGPFASTPVSSSTLEVGSAVGFGLNDSGVNYVAYIFAHDAGGFGLTGEDNVVSCGSFTASALTTVTLGYEPQWVMVKKSSDTGDWYMLDVMRGMSQTTGFILEANLADADFNAGQMIIPTATGFQFNGTNFGSTSGTFIYIAIRRGPMKVPELGTTVYNAIVRNGTQANAVVTGTGFPVDLIFTSLRPAGTHNPVLSDRLRGATKTLSSRGSQAEQTETAALTSFASMDGVSMGADNTGFWNGFNSAIGLSYVNWFFRRAPSFFDEVCYTGTGSATTFSHNLAAVPELIIAKARSVTEGWYVYSAALGATKYFQLNATSAADTAPTVWNATPTSAVFSVGSSAAANESGVTFVAYLFATAPGVSKVGSYTGTAATQVINCGFTTGARFVLIKRTDDVGDWYVWDSVRGIIAGNDPYLQINNTNAEVTNTDYVDTAATGFELTSTAPAAINASGGSYIFLAIS